MRVYFKRSKLNDIQSKRELFIEKQESRNDPQNSRQSYEYVVFDFDGTIFDTQPAIVANLKQTFTHFKQLHLIDELNFQQAISLGIMLHDTFKILAPGFKRR